MRVKNGEGSDQDSATVTGHGFVVSIDLDAPDPWVPEGSRMLRGVGISRCATLRERGARP